MKLLKRLMIAAVAVIGSVAVAATPASAIVGGHDATQQYSGMAFVAVEYPGIGTAQCGGTLITASILLTAEHCIVDEFVAPSVIPVPAERVSFHIGSNDRTTGGFRATAEKILPNPDFAWGLPTGLPISDLALVKLTRPVPARLMLLAARQLHYLQTVRAIGWGLTAYPVPDSYPLPTMLQQRDLTVLPPSACAGGGIGDAETCVSTGPCFGDSGSPLLVHAWSKQWMQVGLGSRETSDPDDPNANPCDGPIIYTDPTYAPFRQWIADTIRTEHTELGFRPTVRSLSPEDRVRINQLKPRIIR
jgi:hypothetical protein